MLADSTITTTTVNMDHVAKLSVQPCKNTAGRWSVVALLVTGDRVELSCWKSEKAATKVYGDLLKQWRKQ